MNYLEALKTLREFSGGPKLALRVSMSGTSAPLEIYLRAAAARHGVDLTTSFLPFNTLPQALLAPAPPVPEVYLLCPWDLASETDWRSGIPIEPPDISSVMVKADEFLDRVRLRAGAGLFYLAAPLVPVWCNPVQDDTLARLLEARAIQAGADVLPAEQFSIESYFSSGCPIGGAHLSTVAERVVDRALAVSHSTKKVLVTDFDGTLWHGVLAEDGLKGIQYGPEGRGFRHFVFQTFLAQTRRQGTLLAGVTRNDPALVGTVFSSKSMLVRDEDFVAIMASYGAKSSQIRTLAEQLNLGLDAFVFVDDNVIELEEVASQLPAVTCVRFPVRDSNLPSFLSVLSKHFARTDITSEDRERTELYRRRLSGLIPSDVAGADLTEFLRGLGMSLTIRDRTHDDRTRAVQLINKTNQFNINGLRRTDEEVGRILNAGGRLFTASLTDRTGSHGEILACLMDSDGVVVSLVMSCRVFQRKVEHAFMAWLARLDDPPRCMQFKATERNEPIRTFLTEITASSSLGAYVPFRSRPEFDAILNSLFSVHEG